MPLKEDPAKSIRSDSQGLSRPILLIDDDRDMAEMLAEYLRPEGFDLHLAYKGKDGLERLKDGGLMLVILDVMLPDLDGFTVLREIRRTSHIPVVMLTTRSAMEDKLIGLNGGADDYIPKPFTPVELLARIRSVLRRTQPSRFGLPFLTIEDLTLDTGSRTIERGGRTIDCTAAEFDVLHALVSSAGQVVTREHLTRVALGRSPYAGDRAIDNLVSALRKKLGPYENGQERFRSSRNTGYIYLRSRVVEPQGEDR
ncbi:response regulator transcription factor [Occallatibacter riparius]|uniref:Response regulator transcription factor n=1 Tax=Occallatibacter riparius TaxID=1002689 RepID=A0A9J7BIS4_9BACT|nr:response regulator transcription factor [Occallatibacter riparius]UWZ82828.1 response regulator transcription factor [Occallatibacter riparius]